MNTHKPSQPAPSREAEKRSKVQRGAATKARPAKKPDEKDDMPGADGFRSARADEDTYD